MLLSLNIINDLQLNIRRYPRRLLPRIIQMHLGLHEVTVCLSRFLRVLKDLDGHMDLHGLSKFLWLRCLLSGAIVCKLRGVVLAKEEVFFDCRLAIRILI